MKHKTQDYKISAVKYYLQNDVSLDEVCDIFVCKKSSLRRWIMKYKAYKHIERLNRSSKSYKITKDIDKIICLDETSIQPAMMLEYSRCQLGHKCVVNTDDIQKIYIISSN
jgi:transposase-like protein